MTTSARANRWLPAFSAAISIFLLSVILLSIMLAVSQELDLSAAESASWIFVVFALPGLLSLPLALIYRQPIHLTGNFFAIVFVASLGDQLGFPELVGAFIVAGGAVVLISVLGLSERLGDWIPEPVVLGLLAGSIVPFVTGAFTSLGEAPSLVGGTFAVYVLARRFLGDRLPAILPALLAGLVIAGVTRQYGQVSAGLMLPLPVVTLPVFNVRAIVTATPVVIVLMSLQANIPSIIILKSQDYRPPERMVEVVGGVGTALGSLIGPTALALSLPVASIVAGPGAGEKRDRYLAASISATFMLLIGLLAGLAAELPAVLPRPLLLALAGLGVIDILAGSLTRLFRGRVVFGPLVAFTIVLSDISLFGFGPFFWALVLGTAVTWLLEREEFRATRG